MNEALKIRITGRIMILAVVLPLLWFSLTTLGGSARVIAPLGLLVVSYVSVVVVDKFAKRKTLPSPSETEKY